MVMGEKTCCKHTLLINSKFIDSSDNAIILGKTTDKKLTFSKAKIDSNFIVLLILGSSLSDGVLRVLLIIIN